jgi:hypothetical protein
MVKTKSDATAVQFVYSLPRGLREIEHIGSAHDEAELEALKAAARQRMAARQGGGPLPINTSRMSHLADARLPGAGARGRGGRGRRVPSPGAGADH